MLLLNSLLKQTKCGVNVNIFFSVFESLNTFKCKTINWSGENKTFEIFVIKRNVSLIQNLDGFVCQKSVACNLLGIIYRNTTPNAVAPSLVAQQVTGSKESVKLLHWIGTGISYTGVIKEIRVFLWTFRTFLSCPKKYTQLIWLLTIQMLRSKLLVCL